LPFQDKLWPAISAGDGCRLSYRAVHSAAD